ncbi:hypothetical protein HUA74_29485 [Myxococcus sp. CA051A]|uniref:Uncharacterized protein n=1 Tax=Myxococcus llanfairpwllgwyngyllgogerychwyrndrobwllllantysiliogogogochensis TaxID=2590453 RepID=A0A540WTF0_9BACT|nr:MULTISPECIES: hypothetical protein [Myxococcus]NTX04316.1 hypothetical protein [Myxococcus sp. CA040A]NTX13064.1 hypothetical protein [Myxococcus sp. CA056]NTX36484.1 hypothetical protein [Myxococcus sp. CA033]NTX53614.1 hypothetical protein [Myxococcus sp. CA039A]NTX64792.1 hypothetical protein [Myxococcus sp. CA051A]
MRIPPAPLLALLVPFMALAQVPQDVSLSPEESSGPSYWYWVALLVIAAAVFAWVSVRLSRRHRGPPPTSRPRRSTRSV